MKKNNRFLEALIYRDLMHYFTEDEAHLKYILKIELLASFYVEHKMQEAIDKIEFDKKYKKVIKKNWLGFTSIEYHEREQKVTN
jgi:hypothetical protein